MTKYDISALSATPSGKRIETDFCFQGAETLAPELIGKLLCRRLDDGNVLRGRITETECYRGEDDTACHAHRGKTPRNSAMYKCGGHAYIYLCYGIHSLLNIVAGPENYPEAVLIRGIVGFPGPGRVTKALFIDRSLNEEYLPFSDKLWIEDDGCSPIIGTGERIGIDYASEADRKRPWRFFAEAFK